MRKPLLAISIGIAVSAPGGAALGAATTQPEAAPANEPSALAPGQCDRLRAKLVRQRDGLRAARTPAKRALIRRNIARTKTALRRRCGPAQQPEPPAGPANQPPVITSPATASLPENTSLVLNVTASDPDGDTPSYSISGGADAAQFAIGASSGALSFVSAPDFESPQDAGAGNVYEVVVAVTDGRGGTATQSVSVSVTDVSDAAFSIGGTLSGLNSGETVVLQNNGGDNTPLNTDGSFTFPTPVLEGSSYNVTILLMPAGQVCSVTNGSGTAESNVTNVQVSCSDGP
jgi:hypothetical protein